MTAKISFPVGLHTETFSKKHTTVHVKICTVLGLSLLLCDFRVTVYIVHDTFCHPPSIKCASATVVPEFEQNVCYLEVSGMLRCEEGAREHCCG